MSFRACPEYDFLIRQYRLKAAKYDWLEVILEAELVERMEEIAQDERNFVAIWGVWAPRPTPRRKAIFTRVYSEPFDTDESKMIGYHCHWLSSLRANVRHMDAIFGHTPWMAEKLAHKNAPGHVLPMGWDPLVLGRPNWDATKKHRFTYKGDVIGKRKWLVPGMQGALGKDMHQSVDEWGADFVTKLNNSTARLELSHSDTFSFPTFSLWQTLASSAALIAEKQRDCWPLEEDMYVGVPTITRANGPQVARTIASIPDSVYASKARRAYDSLADEFTLERVIADYLIPASEQIKDEKQS